MFSVACTQTVIIYKPSPQLDPMPILDTQTSAAENSDEKANQKPLGVDPLRQQQWALQKMGITSDFLEKSEDLVGNYNVKVALLSTGVDYNHKDLRGQFHVNKEEITQDGIADEMGVNQKDDDDNGLVDDILGYDVIDNDGLAYDHHGAGTAVAGIIAAKSNNGEGISGLMKEVTLYPIRYINDNGQTNLAYLLKALEIVVKTKPDVVFVQQLQFQLGGRDRNADQITAELSVLKEKLDKLRDLKIPLVVGAGEDIEAFGSSEIDKLIKGYENIIIVTSTNEQDELSFIAKYSFSGVHTAAPGENILTTQPYNQYGKVSGTAYAAAYVTAALALAKAKHADKVPIQELVSKLLSEEGSDYVRTLERYSRGSNRLNIKKYLASIKN